MFAGDTESIQSFDPSGPSAPLPTPLPCQTGVRRSKSCAQPSRFTGRINELEQAMSQVSVREQEFGWSGSVGGIRGRDDRQIERDMEYERKVSQSSLFLFFFLSSFFFFFNYYLQPLIKNESPRILDRHSSLSAFLFSPATTARLPTPQPHCFFLSITLHLPLFFSFPSPFFFALTDNTVIAVQLTPLSFPP